MNDKLINKYNIDDLLLVREANSLKYTVIGRLLLIVFTLLSFVYLLLFPDHWLLKKKILVIIFIIEMLIFSLVSIYFFYLIKRKEKLNIVGLGGLGLDFIILFSMPLFLYYSIDYENISPVFLLKTPLPMLTAMLMIINSFAIRPKGTH